MRDEVLNFLMRAIVGIVIIVGGVILLWSLWVGGDNTMSLKEIKKHRQKLIQIQKMPEENERIEALKDLCKVVGAGTVHTKITGATTSKTTGSGTITRTFQNPISESELIQNINDSLQTGTMVEMCRLSGNNVIVAIVAASAACISALSAWATTSIKRGRTKWVTVTHCHRSVETSRTRRRYRRLL